MCKHRSSLLKTPVKHIYLVDHKRCLVTSAAAEGTLNMAAAEGTLNMVYPPSECANGVVVGREGVVGPWNM